MTPHPKAIEAAARAYDKACGDWPMLECPRCKGVGYHHGFGENGHDPDWCDVCGGPGLVPDEKYEPMSAAIIAYFGTLAVEGMSREAMGQEVLGAWIADSSEQVEEPNEFPVTIIREVK